MSNKHTHRSISCLFSVVTMFWKEAKSSDETGGWTAGTRRYHVEQDIQEALKDTYQDLNVKRNPNRERGSSPGP